jgi:phosphatidate cytidylyltransferase
LKERLLAAIVGLAVLLPAIIWGGTVAVEIIVPLAMLVCLDEYSRMAFPDDRPASLAWLVLSTFVGYGAALYLADRWIGVTTALVTIGTLIFVVLRPEPLPRAADKAGRMLLGTAWLAGTFAFLPLLRRLEDGLAWIFLTLALAWLADTGAYFAGRFFGKRKLYERISPKKTWEGYFGGIIVTTAGVFVVRAVGLPSLTPVDAVVIGVVVGTAGVLGDLAESMLKRAFDVKDSGWIMPGHGGLLDRVDSVLFIAPLLYGYAVLIKGY